jgi:rare lipoprotein A
MSSISRQRFGVGEAVRVTGIVLTAATLAACAQSSVSNKSAFHDGGQSTTTDRQRTASREAAPTISHHRAASTIGPRVSSAHASLGLASYYEHGTRTASGEQFDASQLTAAHPTLPFGTRLRVTNVATGQSVTVRVNDRGPYVPGRVVDVSHSAAQSLGLVGPGLAKVKLDVVQ